MIKQQLSDIGLLKIKAPNGGFYMGGSQNWFHDSWKRMSGCGPTTASGMLWYLARSRQNSALCEIGGADMSIFLKLMDIVFGYITPGMMGVNSTGIFVDGVVGYGNSRGVKLQTRVLDISPAVCKRPDSEALCDFILQSLSEDLPLAFLNLSNGSLVNLDNWHWVMIVALEPHSMTATICDQGGTKEISLGEWLNTTALGGGLVSIHIAD